MTAAVYAGTFDPDHARPPLGRRARRAALRSADRRGGREPEQGAAVLAGGAGGDDPRRDGRLAQRHCAITDGYVVDLARACGARYLVRGVRGGTDVDAEIALADLNRELAPEIETVFIPAHPELSEVSSSRLKELVRRGEDVSRYCPPEVAARLAERLGAASPTGPGNGGGGHVEPRGDRPRRRRHVLGAPLHRARSCSSATASIWPSTAPTSTARVLAAAGRRSGRELTLSAIDHVLITHVHGDHMNGLEGVAFYKHFVDGRRLGLVTSPEVRDVIWEQRLAGQHEPSVGRRASPRARLRRLLRAPAPRLVRRRRARPVPHPGAPHQAPRADQRAPDRGRRAHARLLGGHRLRSGADRLPGAGGPDRSTRPTSVRRTRRTRRWRRCRKICARACASSTTRTRSTSPPATSPRSARASCFAFSGRARGGVSLPAR